MKGIAYVAVSQPIFIDHLLCVRAQWGKKGTCTQRLRVFLRKHDVETNEV